VPYVEDALARTDHNVKAAAELAGINRANFYRMMTRCGFR
jgi:transcriptional regulator of acetoin/glycerol metabolism